MSNSVMLEIMTPQELIYKGNVESLIVNTSTGEEGYMPGHVWCRKLLAEGTVRLREPGSSEMKRLRVKDGFVEIRDDFTVYTEEAEWE